MTINYVLETCIYVTDLDVARDFYKDVLGLEFLGQFENRHAFFRCNSQVILLFNANETRKATDVPAHGMTGEGHVAFAIKNDEIEDWKQRLIQHGVEIEQVKQWDDRGYSVYFRDPSGNSLEVATPRIWNIPED